MGGDDHQQRARPFAVASVSRAIANEHQSAPEQPSAPQRAQAPTTSLQDLIEKTCTLSETISALERREQAEPETRKLCQELRAENEKRLRRLSSMMGKKLGPLGREENDLASAQETVRNILSAPLEGAGRSKALQGSAHQDRDAGERGYFELRQTESLINRTVSEVSNPSATGQAMRFCLELTSASKMLPSLERSAALVATFKTTARNKLPPTCRKLHEAISKHAENIQDVLENVFNSVRAQHGPDCEREAQESEVELRSKLSEWAKRGENYSTDQLETDALRLLELYSLAKSTDFGEYYNKSITEADQTACCLRILPSSDWRSEHERGTESRENLRHIWRRMERLRPPETESRTSTHAATFSINAMSQPSQKFPNEAGAKKEQEAPAENELSKGQLNNLVQTLMKELMPRKESEPTTARRPERDRDCMSFMTCSNSRAGAPHYFEYRECLRRNEENNWRTPPRTRTDEWHNTDQRANTCRRPQCPNARTPHKWNYRTCMGDTSSGRQGENRQGRADNRSSRWTARDDRERTTGSYTHPDRTAGIARQDQASSTSRQEEELRESLVKAIRKMGKTGLNQCLDEEPQR